MRLSFALRSGWLLALSVAACTPIDSPLPLFNAVDPSIQCKPGEIGWDFSTGGNFDEAVRDSTLSSEIRIVEASYGTNCSGVAPDNVNAAFASACNGRLSCQRKVNEGIGDPAPGCPKDFLLRYTCGNEGRVYEQRYGGEAGGTAVSIECGDKLIIRDVTYGQNCNASIRSNLTTSVIEQCNGARRCDLGTGAQVLGSDPAPFCRKETKVTYGCVGAGAAEYSAVFDEETPMRFACPIRQATPPPEARITISFASYGANCGPSARNNATSALAQLCNGKGECTFTVSLGDPAPGCAKSLFGEYRCGIDSKVILVPAEAGGKTVTLRCGQRINVVQASYGSNCDPKNLGNATEIYRQNCNANRDCVIGRNVVHSLGDPAPFCRKDHEVRYTCGSSGDQEFRASAGEDEVKVFECPLEPVRPEFSKGIQLLEATWGTGCAGAETNLKNNAYAQLSSCNGRDTCELTFPGIGRDVAPNCPKPLQAKYRCGEDPTVETVDVAGEAQGKSLKLTCSPPIRVLRATYGGTCGLAQGNASAGLTQSCGGKRGSCVYTVPARPSEVVLPVNGQLTPGERLSVAGGTGTFELTRTGEIVFSRNGVMRWTSGTENATMPATVLAMQSDGNLVLSRGSTVLWSTGTSGNNDAVLGLNAEGRLVVRATDGRELWAPTVTLMAANAKLTKGQQVPCGDSCRFALQTDGNLVLSRNNVVLFATGTQVVDVANVTMQGDGNLVVFGSGNEVRWSSATNSIPAINATLNFDQSTNRLVLLDTSKRLFWPACRGDFSVDYVCGANPAIQKAAVGAEAAGTQVTLSCPTESPAQSVKKCVPTNCIGTQRRGLDLACVTDSSLRVMPTQRLAKLSLVDVEQNRETLALQEDIPYTVVASFQHDTPCASCVTTAQSSATATVWAYDEFTSRSTGTRVKGFRCVVTTAGLRGLAAGDPLQAGTTFAANAALVGGMVGQTISPLCFGNRINSWRDAAKRKAMTEADFRKDYNLSGSSTLVVSYDPEGKTVAFRGAPGTTDTAFVPNPIGFFYKPNLLWVDSYSYYDQTSVHEVPNVAFTPSRDIRLAATKATLRSNELEVSLYDSFITPSLEVDVDWLMRGDAPGVNPFSPTGPPVTPSVATLTQRNLAVTLELTPAEDFTSSSQPSTGWVAFDKHMVVSKPSVTKVGSGQATGQTIRVVAPFNDTLKDRILKVGGNGWRRTFGEELRSYRVRACLELDGLDRTSSSNNDVTALSASRGPTTYTAGFLAGKRCVVSDQLLIIRRDLEKRPFPRKSQSEESSGQGTTRNQGDGSYIGSGNDLGNQSQCGRSCTVNADCVSGQTCNGVGGRVGFCSGVETAVSCASIDRNDMGSTGAIGRSLYSSTTTTNTRSAAAGTTGGTSRASVGSRTEILGYTVLSAGDDKASEGPITTGWQRFEINLTPNIDNIITLLKTGSVFTPPVAPLKPKFEKIQATETTKGRIGLGVGVGREFYIMILPVPIAVEVSATVGFGISLTINVGISNSAYPCAGETSTCVKRDTMTRTLDEAMTECAVQGGRLAEMERSGAYAALRSAIGTDTNAHWVGAQLGYTYSNETCARQETASGCRDSTTTRWRWMHTGNEFATQVGNGSITATPGNVSAGVSAATNMVSAVRTLQPAQAGVIYTASSDRFGSAPRDTTTKYHSLCEFRPAASARTLQIGGGPTVDVSAGATLAVCVPSHIFGFCLQASLRVVSAEITGRLTWTNTKLYNVSGALLGTRSNLQLKFDWAVRLLTGAITAQLRMVLTDLEWDIVKFEGIQSLLDPEVKAKFSGTLLKLDWPTVKDIQ
jgi:hypothetical protein